MNIEQLEQNIQSLVTNLNEETFVYDLLRAYELPKASITRLQKGRLQSLEKTRRKFSGKNSSFSSKLTEEEGDLHVLIDNLKNDPTIKKTASPFYYCDRFSNAVGCGY